uniref:Uncharacterized protein n=1 Tax=Lepeophtheirus salmonis TaxID=72036 RepID=A0A0K2VFU0_LEPSM
MCPLCLESCDRTKKQQRALWISSTFQIYFDGAEHRRKVLPSKIFNDEVVLDQIKSLNKIEIHTVQYLPHFLCPDQL